MKHVTHKELQESFDQIPESSRREICDMIVALYTGYDVSEEFKFAVVHAYKCGLRDGGKREPLTEVPEHVWHDYVIATNATDSHYKPFLAALKAYDAGEQPAESPSPSEQQMSKIKPVQEEMTAGPELDRLVAENVMGWETHEDIGYVGGRVFIDPKTELVSKQKIWPSKFKPSTDISVAWKVVEKMTAESRFGFAIYNVGTKDFSCKFFSGGKEWWNFQNDDPCAHSAPLAICLAALRAVEGGDDDNR